MPARAKTSDADIVAAARAIIASDGVEALSLGAVAAAVGVKAPSLYKRFVDRSTLIEAVRSDVLRQLATVLSEAVRGRDPAKNFLALGRAYRRFGLDHPRLYSLIPGSGGEPSQAARAAVAPVFALLADLVGEELTLPAARCVTAYVHGFVEMEISRNFQLGGSIEEAFEFGLATILRGLGPTRPPSRRRPAE